MIQKHVLHSDLSLNKYNGDVRITLSQWLPILMISNPDIIVRKLKMIFCHFYFNNFIIFEKFLLAGVIAKLGLDDHLDSFIGKIYCTYIVKKDKFSLFYPANLANFCSKLTPDILLNKYCLN